MLDTERAFCRSRYDDQISVLPMELWARVFKELEPTPGTPEWDWHPVMLKAQTSFWQLLLVCKGFCNVFRTHLELGHHILLNKKKLKSGNQRVAASLVPWLEARAAVVKTFHANHWSKEHQSSGLTIIELTPRHKREVTCLASFTALKSCCLHSSCHIYQDTVDLTPLRGLQMLTKLSLNMGHYSGLSSLSHLDPTQHRSMTQATRLLPQISFTSKCKRATWTCCMHGV